MAGRKKKAEAAPRDYWDVVDTLTLTIIDSGDNWSKKKGKSK